MLILVRINDESGHFRVDPRNVKQLNSEQRKAAQRLYGPDEENFGLNMDLFAEAGQTPYVFTLLPDYVQDTLRSNDKTFLGRASWLVSFGFGSAFYAFVCGSDFRGRVRGVRREEVARSASPESGVPRALQKTEKV